SVERTSDDTGALREVASYDAWGARRNADWTAPAMGPTLPQDTRISYTGQRADDEWSFVDMNAREYDPFLKRFLDADTIVPHAANGIDWNRYAYARDNPLRYVDPSGHESIEWGPSLSLLSFFTGMSMAQAAENVYAIHVANDQLADAGFPGNLIAPDYL